jgi:hypothetical protein
MEVIRNETDKIKAYKDLKKAEEEHKKYQKIKRKRGRTKYNWNGFTFGKRESLTG